MAYRRPKVGDIVKPRKKPERRGPRRFAYYTAAHSTVICDRLHAAGMTSWELADLLGVHEHEIDLEELPHQPLRVVYELARRLDAHPADFVLGAEDLYDRRTIRRPAPEPDDPAAHDALIVLTALGHADRALRVEDLSDALVWDFQRVEDALDFACLNPHPLSPVVLRRVPPEHYTVTARLDLLSNSQTTMLIAHHEPAEQDHKPQPQREPIDSADAAVLVDVLRHQQILNADQGVILALDALIAAGYVERAGDGGLDVTADVAYSLGLPVVDSALAALTESVDDTFVVDFSADDL